VIKILLELINLKLEKLLLEVKKMSTKYDAMKTKLDELSLIVDDVVTQNTALKAQVADSMTNEEFDILAATIESQKQKIQSVL
jgi:hypothetical protein